MRTKNYTAYELAKEAAQYADCLFEFREIDYNKRADACRPIHINPLESAD